MAMRVLVVAALFAMVIVTVEGCQIPNMGDEFVIEGGQGPSFFEGEYIFDVGQKSEFGTIREDVWASTETLVWIDKKGSKIARFERAQRNQGFLGGTTTWKDNNNIIVSDCEGKPRYVLAYFPAGVSFAEMFKSFGENWNGNGHYRILSLDDATDGNGLETAVTRESTSKPGGGNNFNMSVMVSHATVPDGCMDRDKEFCFKAALKSLCQSSSMPVLGERKSKCDGTVRECCPMSCKSPSVDPEKKCNAIDVLEDEPAATLDLEGDGYGKRDTWTIEIAKGAPASHATDPRVLVGLAIMKTAGERFWQREEKDKRGLRGGYWVNDSFGTRQRFFVALFSSWQNIAILLGFLAVAIGFAYAQSGGERQGVPPGSNALSPV